MNSTPSLTANERFKNHWRPLFWSMLIVATVLHAAAFVFWPEMQSEDMSFTSEELKTIELPPEIEIPPPPQQIARPATPVIAEASIDEDITIAPTTFEENPVEELPPPPADEEQGNIADAPTFTPYTVAPSIINERDVVRAMERAYPPLLRDAGIGGTVRVNFFIDEDGIVRNASIEETSGHEALDQAALDVAEVYRFSPALNRDKKVPVWVVFPITFQVR